MKRQNLDAILTLHKAWLEGEAGGIRANFTGADLSCEDFTDADLSGAILIGADFTRADFTGADLTSAKCTRANFTAANFSAADLTRADFTRVSLLNADIGGADITGTDFTGTDITAANLKNIRADIFRVCDSAPGEVEHLRAMLVAGKVNGSVYDGECSCLCGTIAARLGVPIRIGRPIPGTTLVPCRWTLAERWAMGIKPGDTPENSPIVKVTVGWIDEWIAARAGATTK